MRKQLLGTFAAVALLALTLTAAGAVTIDAWDGTDPITENVTVSEDTETIRVLAENVTNDSASVTVSGIDADGNLTQVATGTLTTDETNGTYTDTFEYSSVNASKYGEYRVEVTGDGADTVEIVQTGVLSGGSGLIGGVGIPQNELIAAGIVGVVLVGGYGYRQVM
jgi:hypothetical protein